MSSSNYRLILAALIAAIALATLLFDASAALSGKIPQIGRCAVALFGLIAAAMLASDAAFGGIDGRRLALAWAVVQLPHIAWTLDGSPNVQALVLPFGVTFSNKVNETLTSYGNYGLNLPPILLIWLLNRFAPARKLEP